MSAVQLQLNMSVSLRFTVNTLNWSQGQEILGPEFNLKGGRWKLRYGKTGSLYCFFLCKCSGSHPNPLHVLVHLEGSEGRRILHPLTQDKLFTTEFEKTNIWCPIWKVDPEILRANPEFCLYGFLHLLVELKLEDSDASQTERSTKSTSTQTTLLIPCLESLSKDLDRLMVEGSHHDVEFHCAGHSTKAHKSIVCQRSPVIASMLATDMVEGKTGIVNIPDIAPDIFAQFMRYIYCGQVGELTYDSALRLFEAGDQYEVLGLAKMCSAFLLEQLSVDNAYEVLVVADAHNDKECVKKVVDFMVESRVPWVSEEWLAFCDEHSKLANKVLNQALKVPQSEELPALAASESVRRRSLDAH